LAFYNCGNLLSVTFHGLITEENFAGTYFNSPFDGDLRDVYFDEGGGIGTYIRDDDTWTKE